MDSGTGLYYLQSRYYDPALGRFINEDIYVATAQRFIGCNMFSYCLNNPANYADYLGTDAIVVHETGSAKGAGHTGLIVQDDDGQWYFFYWGPTSEEEDFGTLVKGTSSRCEVVPLNTDGLDMTSLEDIEEALSRLGKENEFVMKRAKLIDVMIYLEGDYSNTVDYIKWLDSTTSFNKYSLVGNNCVQQTIAALSASDPRFHGEIPLIPNLAMGRIIARAFLDPTQIFRGLQSDIM